MYVNVYSTDQNVDRNFLHDFATVSILPKIKRTRGIGSTTILGNRIFAMRVWLNPDRLRASNVSSEDVMKALSEQSMIRSLGRLGQATGKTSQSKEYVLTYIGRFNKPEQYANIILKANPDGEILRLKDVGEVELGPPFFDTYSDINGYPSAAIILKQLPGSNAAAVIDAVKKKLEEIKAESFPAGMNFEVIPLERQSMIYGVIQTPPGSTLEYTSAKSHELQAIAKGIDEVTSVSSLAGYEVLTDGRGSNAATCLINLQNRSKRKLTSRQIIERLEEKGRQMPNVTLEFFEPPAVSVFGAAGGFSVRFLDKTNDNAERLGKLTEKFMDDLAKRKEMEGLFTFFASNYPEYELVINNDVATQKGVSIANAMDGLAIIIGRYVQAEPKFRIFPEEFENWFVKNDRGEMVPFTSFVQLKKKQGLNEINR